MGFGETGRAELGGVVPPPAAVEMGWGSQEVSRERGPTPREREREEKRDTALRVPKSSLTSVLTEPVAA